MNKLEELLYNNGERLVPYVSHDDMELVRHRSSYSFFRNVVICDIENNMYDKNQCITLADLGFGTGYGCALLSSIPNSCITGIDIGSECEVYAKKYYARKNVSYIIEDLAKFIPEMNSYDYVVSRGVLEHVNDGINIIGDIKFSKRVMVDVPYDEPAGNEFHVITGVKEEDFSYLDCYEIFYEDIDGAIYDQKNKPSKPNMIMLVISSPGMPKVGEMFDFPICPVVSTSIETDSLASHIGGVRNYYENREEFLKSVMTDIKESDVVVDIGCGVMPMNYFRPKLHIMVEPYREYVDILTFRYSSDKSVLIFNCDALGMLKSLADNSVDSVFLLDVIEHLERQVGESVIKECERVTRQQIVIFTPLGFMPQHVEKDEADGWGLSGHEYQEHRSGWCPDDFGPEWSFYICNDFHVLDHHGAPLEQSHGAFYAVRNFDFKASQMPDKFPTLHRNSREDALLQRIKELESYCSYLENSNSAIRNEYHNALNNRSILKKMLNIIKPG